MSAHAKGDLVVEPSIRHEHQPQTFRVVSLAEKKANEWRKDWYWPSVLCGLTKAQADLFSAAPDLLDGAEIALAAITTALVTRDELDDIAEQLRAAIAKARGKTDEQVLGELQAAIASKRSAR